MIIANLPTSLLSAYIAIAVTIFFTVAGQILQKRVADLRNAVTTPATSTLQFYFRQPQFWMALTCLGLAMIAWIYALTSIEVSKAYALLSVNYLLVPLVARWLFAERLSKRQWSGALLLCLGLTLIGRS